LEVIPEEQDFAEREEGVQREQTSEARPVANEAYDPGDVIAGQFEVIERLGFGGFARVYRVRWIMNDREYALKVFRTSDSIDTVKREIKALQAVSHPRIVNVVWGGETSDGQGYIVSELLDGETLEAYATGEKWLSLAEAVRVAFELLEGLGAIHPDSQRIKDLEARGKAGEIEIEEYEELRALKGRGLVHRDIKPQNLLLTRRGIVLIDFGVASRVGDRVLTVRGTPPYQPPDIIPGADTWDVSPDLFAAGVVLYQLVCHEHPYQNWEPCLDQEPREPRQFRPELPAEFVEFLTRACAPRRQDRFATADEMRAALDTASTRLW
jgi:serine/threonine protein kinase